MSFGLTIHREERRRDVECWLQGKAPGETVKENRGRRVWRVATGAPALYVKQFPPSLLRDRAAREAGMLRQLAEAGIPCPRLVANGRNKAGSFVITEEVPDARILKSLLAGGGVRVRPLLLRFASLIRRLHDAGFDHQDLHGGNVLLSAGEMFVLDVHRARRVRRFTAARRRARIGFAALSLVEQVTTADLVRFLRACGLESREEVRRAVATVDRLKRRYYRGRDGRCVREGTGFGLRAGLYYRKGIDVEAVLSAVDRPDGTEVKRTAKESLHRLPNGWFVKRTTPARALAIWKNGHAMSVRGVRTPRLYARKGGVVVGEWIEAPTLTDFISAEYRRMARSERLEFLGRFARAVRHAHEAGVLHRDLKANNVLVAEGGPCFVDVDRVAFGGSLPDGARTLNLAQLNASLTPPLSRTDRLRFLAAYFGCNHNLWRRRREWIAEIMRITLARRHRWPPVRNGREGAAARGSAER